MAEPNGRGDLRFPLEESFHDCCGRERRFRIECLVHAGGYFLRASEITTDDDEGYEFAAHSGTGAGLALGALRAKIRKGLSVRYLADAGEELRLSHDTMRGHVGYGGVVVDGRFMAFGDLVRLLQTYEGFQFSLRIADPYENL